MKLLVGSSGPGNTKALLPVIKALKAKGHEIIAIGEEDGTSPRYASGGDYRMIGLESIDLASLSSSRFDVAKFESVIRQNKPDIVLTSSSRPAASLEELGELTIDQALITAAKQTDTPSVVVEDIWGSYVPISADECKHVCVVDGAAARILKYSCGDGVNIRITGNPAFDSITGTNILNTRATLRSKLGLSENDFLILYGGQVTPDNLSSLNWVVDNLRPSDFLYFGKHPRDVRDYQEITDRAGGKIIETKIRLDDLLPAADLVVTHYSTVGLTAVLMGIDVINIHIEGDVLPFTSMKSIEEYPLVSLGASLGASDEHKYAKYISNFSRYRTNLRAAREIHYSSKQSSTARVVAAIDKLMCEM
jgi:hypothetical protein